MMLARRSRVPRRDGDVRMDRPRVLVRQLTRHRAKVAQELRVARVRDERGPSVAPSVAACTSDRTMSPMRFTAEGSAAAAPTALALRSSHGDIDWHAFPAVSSADALHLFAQRLKELDILME